MNETVALAPLVNDGILQAIQARQQRNYANLPADLKTLAALAESDYEQAEARGDIIRLRLYCGDLVDENGGFAFEAQTPVGKQVISILLVAPGGIRVKSGETTVCNNIIEPDEPLAFLAGYWFLAIAEQWNKAEVKKKTDRQQSANEHAQQIEEAMRKALAPV